MDRARYRRITFFFAHMLFTLAVWELVLPRLGLRRWAQRTRAERLRTWARRFRLLAVQMGGVLIKVGQFLSARLDVLPQEFTAELTGLQDEVPAESFQDLAAVVESEFRATLGSTFERFDETPLAAVSLGQVHRAWVRVAVPVPGAVPEPAPGDNEAKPALQSTWETQGVVVKIQRPNIETIIATDLAALGRVGSWLEKYPPIRRRADVTALIAEFTRILYEEIDYIAEGHNAETFAENFRHDPGVRVPKVIWTHTRPRVLTLEDVQAIKIIDYEALTQAGIDRGEVARRLINTYLEQIFEHGFFHADPHPGNLFIYPLPAAEHPPGEAPADGAAAPWQLTFVDFGMVGRMPPKLRAGMREMMIGIGLRDAGRLIKAYEMMGVLLPGADLNLLEEAEQEVFDRFWGKNMKDLQQISLKEVQELAFRFRQLIYEMPFQIPEDLILLGRSVGILSGMCTGLDPQFNVWEHIAPFARRLVAEDASRNGPEPWLDLLGSVARRVVQLPGRAENVLDKVERGELRLHDPQLTRQVRQVELAIQGLIGAVIFSALLLAGTQFYLAGNATFGGLLLGGAMIVLIGTAFLNRKGP